MIRLNLQARAFAASTASSTCAEPLLAEHHLLADEEGRDGEEFARRLRGGAARGFRRPGQHGASP